MGFFKSIRTRLETGKEKGIFYELEEVDNDAGDLIDNLKKQQITRYSNLASEIKADFDKSYNDLQNVLQKASKEVQRMVDIRVNFGEKEAKQLEILNARIITARKKLNTLVQIKEAA